MKQGNNNGSFRVLKSRPCTYINYNTGKVSTKPKTRKLRKNNC